MSDHKFDSTELLPDFLTAERNPWTGQLGIMDRTDRPHYDKFCHGIIASLKPANPLETQLAFSIAADYWRLNRTRNIEDGLFASSHPNPTDDFGPTPVDKQIAASQTSAFLCRQSDFKFLSTYEMRIQRTLNRNKADLRQLQTERRKWESEQPSIEAKTKTSPPSPPGLPENGFAFSNSAQTAPAESELSGLAASEPSGGLTVPGGQPQPAAPNGFAFSNASLAPDSSARFTQNDDRPALTGPPRQP